MIKNKFKKFLWACMALLFLTACSETGTAAISVSSVPHGAKIFNHDGSFTGKVTPAILIVKIDENERIYQYHVEKNGYERVDLDFKHTKETEWISLEEGAVHCCVAPCCFGIPLLRFLDVVDIQESYEPRFVKLNLKRQGGGLFLEPTSPPQMDLYVNGVKHSSISKQNDTDEVFVNLPKGRHTVELRAEGFKSLKHNSNRKPIEIMVSDNVPVRIADIKLNPVSSGFYLMRPKGYPLSSIKIVPEKGGDQVVLRDNIKDENYFHFKLKPGVYTITLKGKTFLGKDVDYKHTLEIKKDKVHFQQLEKWGPWEDMRSSLAAIFKKQFSFDVGHNVLTKQSIEVTYVREGSPIHNAGLKKGDVLLRLNNQTIEPSSIISDHTNLEITKMLSRMKPGSPVSLLVKRKDTLIAIRLDAIQAKLFTEQTLSMIDEEDRQEVVLIPSTYPAHRANNKKK